MKDVWLHIDEYEGLEVNALKIIIINMQICAKYAFEFFIFFFK